MADERTLQRMEQKITCPVCCHRFEDPRILPCSHYYCKQCVQALADRAGPNRPFSCPECRCDTRLPQNDPNQLPKALSVVTENVEHDSVSVSEPCYNSLLSQEDAVKSKIEMKENSEDNLDQKYQSLQTTSPSREVVRNEDGSIVHDAHPQNPKKKAMIVRIKEAINEFVHPSAGPVDSAKKKLSNALDYLEGLVKAGNITLDSWEETRRLIENIPVVVPVIGRVKAGKSTLLNALLGKRLLPTDADSATATNIDISFYISDKPPKLKCERNGKKDEIIKGENEVYEKLTDVNTETRSLCTDVNVTTCYYLRAFPPHLRRIGKQNPVLVDVPGVGEVHAKTAIQHATMRGIVSGAIYLVVISCRTICEAGNIELINMITAQDKEAIKDKRVLVAATQYDVHYKARAGASLTKVVESVQEAFAVFDIPSSDIIPVCGEYALNARSLINDPTNSRLHRQVKRQYEEYLDSLPEVTEGNFQEVDSMSSVSLATALEEHTYIWELEARLMEMITADRVTLTKKRSKTAHLIETAIIQLSAAIDKEARLFKDYDAKISKLSTPLKDLLQLTDEVAATIPEDSRNSKVYQALAEKFKVDAQACYETIETRVKEEMVNLKGSCSEKSAKSTRGVKDYLPSEFEQDIKDFVDTVVGDIIKQAMLEANLEATKSEYILLLSDVYIAKHLKMAELLKVLGFEDTDTSRPDYTGMQSKDFMGEEEVKLKDLKNVAENLPPPPTWTHWGKLKAALRVCFTWMSSHIRHEGDRHSVREIRHNEGPIQCVSTEDLDQLFIDVTQRVLSLCHDYVFGESDGTCLHLVVEHFYKMYKKQTDDFLECHTQTHDESIIDTMEFLQKQIDDQGDHVVETLKVLHQKKVEAEKYKELLAEM